MNVLKKTLNSLGLNFLWNDQNNNAFYPENWFKNLVKQRLQDQFTQKWNEEINNSELYYNYRMFKEHFKFEKYLSILPFDLAHSLLKFRTLNHKLPIQRGRILGIERNKRNCVKCDKEEIGDEFHYLFCCKHFASNRKILLKKYYYKFPNAIKYNSLMENKRKQILLNLVKFIRIIFKEM